MPGGDYRDALRVARPAGSRRPGPLFDADGDAGRRARRRGRVHRRPAQGPRRRARRAALRVADRPATEHDHARPARGPRDDDVRARAGHVRRRVAPPGRRLGRRSGPRSASAIGRRSSPRRSARLAGEPPRRPLDRRDRRAGLGGRARPGLCLYDGDACLGGGGSRPAARSRRCGAPTRARGSSPRVTIGPALLLALLVGIFHTALYVLIRGDAGGRLPLLVRRRDPRGLGRRRARRPARHRPRRDRRLPADHCSSSPGSASASCVLADARSRRAREGRLTSDSIDRRLEDRSRSIRSPTARSGASWATSGSAPVGELALAARFGGGLAHRRRLVGAGDRRRRRCATPPREERPPNGLARRARGPTGRPPLGTMGTMSSPAPSATRGSRSAARGRDPRRGSWSSSPSAATRRARARASCRPATRRCCSRTRAWSSSRTR